MSPEHAAVFVNAGCDVNILDDNGKGAIHYAADYKFSASGETHPCLKVIADKADLNLKTIDGDTPMHFAARSGNKETAQFLLENGGAKSCKVSNKKKKFPVQEGLTDFLKAHTF